MKFEGTNNEGVGLLLSAERRKFLKFGFAVTGVFLGGTILTLTSVKNVRGMGSNVLPKAGEFPYSPHYTMVIREHLCIDCGRCTVACVKTNDVPHYGWRTTILEKQRDFGSGKIGSVFMPILCNHCNRPPCVRVCPTTATYKDAKTGIVVMNSDRCIGCKTCMTACPYNARYFKEETRAVDKCNFCWDTRLSKGETDTACVEVCPTFTRVFGDLTDMASRAFELVHTYDKLVWVLRPETGAMPNVFYVNA